MKKIKSGLLTLILMMASLTFIFVSCDKDDDDAVVDKTELDAAITAADALIESTTEGTADGQYLPGSKADFQLVIDAAEVVYANVNATQTDVDNTVIALDAATDAYNDNIVSAIAPDDLIAHWTFDEGTGTTVADFSGNGFEGAFAIHHAELGATNPEWTTDRYGNSGKALNFADGSWIKVPYNIALNPTQITISCWVYADETRANNKILGLYEWQGYKLQLQDANKVFFTANDGVGAWDKDSDPASIVAQTWFHIAVSFGDSEMVFFINGIEVARETRAGFGDLVSISGHDFAIGSDIDIPWDGWNLDNGSYFTGSIDEVRLYKSVLTPAQISSIYNLEKVPE